jgi:hypothetical protein
LAWIKLFRFRPNTCWFAFGEKFQMDQIGIAANGAVFDIFLLGSRGTVQRDLNLLATGRADV